MSGSNVIILVAVILAVDGCIVPLVISAVVNANWNPMAEKYPPVPVKGDAVRRDFQSFAVGSLKLGWCIHVAVDDGHLHLYPCWFARRISVKPASIPWHKLERESMRGVYAQVRLPELLATSLRGPRWCLDLAPSRPE